MGSVPLSRFDNLTGLVREEKSGAKTLNLFVDGIHCAGCVNKIERNLQRIDGLETGRVNFSTNRLLLRWRGQGFDLKGALAGIEQLGFRLIPVPAKLSEAKKQHNKSLLIAMAVAGFAAMNIMLLSFAVWSGQFSDMGAGTRTLFHWITALIALPTIAFSGRPFFTSALAALKARTLNMDVPISLAVLLASGMSLYETILGGQHAYFDAAVMLVFFLLVGRYLDGLARASARSVAEQFLALQTQVAQVIGGDGKISVMAIEDVRPGMTVLVRPGEKVPVDGILSAGASDIDTSLITGENVPRAVAPGDKLFAGMINLTGVLHLKVGAVGEGTLLSEITRLMEAAEQQKSKYVRWADRAAGIYAPVVHILGLLTFLGWWLAGGIAWQGALTIAISVLIITCPCALGIAVPAVHVVAIGRLLKQGIIIKSGDALERLSQLRTIVFDKTGTVTTGRPALVNADQLKPGDLLMAGTLAAASNHPLARALHALTPDAKAPSDVREAPGQGLEAHIRGQAVRLGSRAWCGIEGSGDDTGASEMWLKAGKNAPLRFVFEDSLKSDAAEVTRALQSEGYQVHLLSGDRPGAVARAAQQLGIPSWHAARTPKQKIEILTALKEAGAVLMVGDGLNDSPALALADVSMSPTSAVDISQNAADIVFQGEELKPVAGALAVAHKAHRLVMQNFSLAVLYNIIAIPIAVAGYATPLVAAVAMSSSSILVTLNALRAGRA